MQKYHAKLVKYKYCYRAKILGDIMIDYDTLFSRIIPDGSRHLLTEQLCLFDRKALWYQASAASSGSRQRRGVLTRGKKEATRGIPLSHYGMPDQKCSYFIDLFWRAAREPLRWPSLARVHEEKLRSRWMEKFTFVSETVGGTMTMANEIVDVGTDVRWWFRRFNWNVRSALKSPSLPHRFSLARWLCLQILPRNILTGIVKLVDEIDEQTRL